jgi:hypothetical protein
MPRGQVEILFPLAEVTDTSAQAAYVDGMSNTAYGAGPTLGTTAPGARPHQIATDTLFTAGGGGGGSKVFDRMIVEAGHAADSVSAFLNLLYYEFTVVELGGTFASPPGELQWGFALSAYSVNDPTFTLSDGDTGLPLGYDTNSIGIFDAVTGGSGYAAFGEAPVQGGVGITYMLGHTYGVAVDLIAKTAVYRDCTALLAGPPTAYATTPFGFTSTVYDLSPFGISRFAIGFSLAYKAGINRVNLNPGGSAFVLPPPAGFSPWDGTGNTHLATVGTGLTVSGHNVSAADPTQNGIIYGALSNTTHRLL